MHCSSIIGIWPTLAFLRVLEFGNILNMILKHLLVRSTENGFHPILLVNVISNSIQLNLGLVGGQAMLKVACTISLPQHCCLLLAHLTRKGTRRAIWGHGAIPPTSGVCSQRGQSFTRPAKLTKKPTQIKASCLSMPLFFPLHSQWATQYTQRHYNMQGVS